MRIAGAYRMNRKDGERIAWLFTEVEKAHAYLMETYDRYSQMVLLQDGTFRHAKKVCQVQRELGEAYLEVSQRIIRTANATEVFMDEAIAEGLE